MTPCAWPLWRRKRGTIAAGATTAPCSPPLIENNFSVKLTHGGLHKLGQHLRTLMQADLEFPEVFVIERVIVHQMSQPDVAFNSLSRTGRYISSSRPWNTVQEHFLLPGADAGFVVW